MEKLYKGGCACGAVRFETSSEPVFQNHCQCSDCQKRSGTGHGSYLTFAQKSAVAMSGETTKYPLQGDSGNVKFQEFCPICGTPLFLTFAAMPNLLTISATSLDDPSQFKPAVVTYAIQGQSWDMLDAALQHCDRMPT